MFQKCEKTDFYYLGHPVFVMLLWQPEQMEMGQILKWYSEVLKRKQGSATPSNNQSINVMEIQNGERECGY